ncbi:MAG: hypothetical protein AVO39_06310 [delta proteobacterium MLS_D]|jgi:peptidyl-prolyl cis-trans isomerase C|nr:MAG: hypothetical protein AVO39_06310 [delta proteobacterium MLS_D]
MRVNMKIMWVAVFLMLWILPHAAAAQAAPEKKMADKPAALVNGTMISRDTLEKEVTKIRELSAMKGEQLAESQMENMKHEVLERLINYELLCQESVKEKIPVSSEAVNRELQGLKERFPDEDTYRNTMANMGITQAELESQIKRNLAVKNLLDKKVLSTISVSGEECETFYEENPDHFKEPEQVKASHVFVAVPKDASEDDKKEARGKIDAAGKRLEKGDDFETVAREVSQCPSSEQGGDLGFFARGNMDKTFEDAAFSMKPDETSPVIETSFGYHIIRVTDRKDARVVPFDEAKDTIGKHLKEQKSNKIVEEYVNDLKKSAKIERFL